MEYRVVYKDEHNKLHTLIIAVLDNTDQCNVVHVIMNEILGQAKSHVSEIVSIEEYF